MDTQYSQLIIGLTGGIASGKSTVGRLFRDLDIDVIDADQCARAVVEPGTAGLQSIQETFGDDVIDEAGGLNRAALRALIFSDEQARLALNAITHPLINEEMIRRIAAAKSPYIVLEIPLLVEGLMRDLVHRVLVVDVKESTQIERLLRRDNVSLEQAQATLAAQATREARLAIADDILDNDNDASDLQHTVDALHDKYLALACAEKATDS